MFILRNLKCKLSHKKVLNVFSSNGQTLTKAFISTKNEGKPEIKTPLIKRTFGQPTYESHPHLMCPNEVTPMISQCEYQERRQTLVTSVHQYFRDKNRNVSKHLIVIPSATKRFMSNKIPYFFRQNSEYLYLTGCLEPDSCLVITSESPENYCATLFMQEKDENTELWDGPRTGPANAPNLFGVSQALPYSDLESYLVSFVQTNSPCILWYDYMTSNHQEIDKKLHSCLNAVPQMIWESPKSLIHKQQLIKSPAEITLMQMSCDIASEAIMRSIEESTPGCNEYEIFATVDYECRMRGAEYLAYPPVVAGGNRANIIHYINNNQIVDDGDMVLMDAGCEYHCYTSDITRTWPINGKFSDPQKTLYEAVLDVQLKLLDKLCEFPTLDYLFDEMCLLLGKNLQEIGILSKALTPTLLAKAAYQFCPHHVSHYLGMDVHDTPSINRNIPIKPGMIITVEPGIYIPKGMNKVVTSYQGLGIRIEDDVLITETGPVVLSKKCPKTITEIEQIASLNNNIPW